MTDLKDVWPDGTKVRMKEIVSPLNGLNATIRGISSIDVLCVMYICEIPSDGRIEEYNYNFVVIPSSCLELI